MTTLAEKMKVFEDLSIQLQSLEQEIKDEVMSLGKSQQVGRVKATFYPDGKGSWDWESWGKSLEPDDDVIERNTEVKVTVKWNKITEEMVQGSVKKLQELEQIRELFYTPGKPFVSLSVK